METDQMVRGLGELTERLRLAGASVTASDRAHVLEVSTNVGPELPLLVRWLPGKRAVHFTQPLAITINEPEDFTRAAVAVARLNQTMPQPALVLDLDAGWID